VKPLRIDDYDEYTSQNVRPLVRDCKLIFPIKIELSIKKQIQGKVDQGGGIIEKENQERDIYVKSKEKYLDVSSFKLPRIWYRSNILFWLIQFLQFFFFLLSFLHM